MAKKERKIPDFSPGDLEQIQRIEGNVLNSPGQPAPSQPAGEPPTKPKIWSMFNKGGMVKGGSPKVSAPCHDSKTIKCY